MKRASKLKWWQLWLCRRMCPNFETDMPANDESGTWVACSLKVNFVGRREVEVREVEGLRNAYEVARWLALKLDWDAHSSLGVDWAVRRKNKEEEP